MTEVAPPAASPWATEARTALFRSLRGQVAALVFRGVVASACRPMILINGRMVALPHSVPAAGGTVWYVVQSARAYWVFSPGGGC